MEKLKCVKCESEWYPRTPDKPKMCPACKCRKWWEPKRWVRNVKKPALTEDAQ